MTPKEQAGEYHKYCPCGSHRLYADCCKASLQSLNIKKYDNDYETILIDWLCHFSLPIVETFLNKTKPYVFRISCYLDEYIIDKYFNLKFINRQSNQTIDNNEFTQMKLNTLLSLQGALSCLAQGLFLQSGTLLRSLIEDTLVLLDLHMHKDQLIKFLNNKYTSKNVLTRVKNTLPSCIINWYGYFSSNFTHFGPIHAAPYLPRRCYGENWVIVIGLQNIVRAVVSINIVLELMYIKEFKKSVFWKHTKNRIDFTFNENSIIFDWAEELGKDIMKHFPPDERKEYFTYSKKKYRFK